MITVRLTVITVVFSLVVPKFPPEFFVEFSFSLCAFFSSVAVIFVFWNKPL